MSQPVHAYSSLSITIHHRAGKQSAEGREYPRAVAAPHLPSAARRVAEHFLVAAPAGPEDKEGPGFQTAWQAATTISAARRLGPDIQLPLPLTWTTAA